MSKSFLDHIGDTWQHAKKAVALLRDVDNVAKELSDDADSPDDTTDDGTDERTEDKDESP